MSRTSWPFVDRRRRLCTLLRVAKSERLLLLARLPCGKLTKARIEAGLALALAPKELTAWPKGWLTLPAGELTAARTKGRLTLSPRVLAGDWIEKTQVLVGRLQVKTQHLAGQAAFDFSNGRVPTPLMPVAA